MTPNWLQPMSWLQMQQGQGKSTGQGIAEGAGTIGTALIKRGDDDGDEPQAPAYRPPVQTPAVQQPLIPVPPVLEYGARPTEYRAPETESPLLRRRNEIINMMQGGRM